MVDVATGRPVELLAACQFLEITHMSRLYTSHLERK